MGSQKKKKKRGQNRPFRRPKPGRNPLPDRDKPIIVYNPAGHEKMSDVLLQFVEPFGDWQNEKELETLLNVGIVAWNAALMSGREQHEFLQTMMAAIPAETRADVRSIVAEMMQRKVTLFASNKRMILSFELTATPGAPAAPYLRVISTLDP